MSGAGLTLEDFDFDLPEELIATRPARPRSSARLLVAEGGSGIKDRRVSDLPDILRPGDRLVLNDTRVIPARLSGIRRRSGETGETEARIEATLLGPRADGCWNAMIKPLKKLRIGETVDFGQGLTAELVARDAAQGVLRFSEAGEAFDAALDRAGSMPLPPYIAAKRAPDEED